MALPVPGFYTSTGGIITTHDFGSVEAGAYKPGSTGWPFRFYNAYGSTDSDTMTSTKLSIRGSSGGTDDIWVQQHWVQLKSDGGSTGLTDDAQTVFTAVGKNKELSVGDIPTGEYRTIYARCYPPTDAAEQDVDFQLRATYQDPSTSICNWITGLRGDGVVASTGDPFAMSTGGSTGTIPYEGGYALIYNNEIYYGSSGVFDCSDGSSGATSTIYMTESGSFGITTGDVAINQLPLYETTITSGTCETLTDKRVYLSGMQAGTSGALPLDPDLGDLYFETTNGKVYGAKAVGVWTVLIPGATFLSLTDTPASYTDKSNNLARVTTGEDALEFVTDFSDYTDSAMVITGGVISVGTSGGTYKVTALTAALREGTGDTDNLIYKTLGEQDNQAITAADTDYKVILTYTSSSPTLSLSETVPNGNNAIGLGIVGKTTGNAVHFCLCGSTLADGVGKLHMRASDLRSRELASGCTISYSGTNNVDIAEGVVYQGINKSTPFSGGAFESSGADAFTYVGQSTGPAGWLYTTGVSAIDYNHYDNGTTGLATITAGQYSLHWVYLHSDDEDVYVVYGRDTYKLAEAEVADEPNIPDLVNDYGLLLGKIVAPVAGGSFTTVAMVTDTFFTGTSVATHNDLGGLDSGDYQHITQVEHDLITSTTGVGTDYLSATGGWTAPAGGSTEGVTTFVALTDTPADYLLDASKLLRVNSASGAVEFISTTGIATDTFGLMTDITTNNADASKHGFLLKLTDVATDFLSATGGWTEPTDTDTFLGLSDTPADFLLDASKLLRVNSASGAVEFISTTGIATDTFGLMTDITTNNADAAKHGFLQKLTDVATDYLSSTGGWTAPAGVGNVISSGDFNATRLAEISSSGGASIQASPFTVTTGDIMNFGAHSAGFFEQTISTTTGDATINWNLGNKALFTRSTGAAGAVTFTFTAPENSMNLILIVRNSAVGSTDSVAWPVVKWQGGNFPTMTTGALDIDAVAFYYSTGLTSYLGLGSDNFSS